MNVQTLFVCFGNGGGKPSGIESAIEFYAGKCVGLRLVDPLDSFRLTRHDARGNLRQCAAAQLLRPVLNIARHAQCGFDLSDRLGCWGANSIPPRRRSLEMIEMLCPEIVVFHHHKCHL
jgi:hypothetical protein